MLQLQCQTLYSFFTLLFLQNSSTQLDRHSSVAIVISKSVIEFAATYHVHF